MLLAEPCTRSPDGFFYRVGYGAWHPEDVYMGGPVLDVRVEEFFYDRDGYKFRPSHYCPLYPPGQ